MRALSISLSILFTGCTLSSMLKAPPSQEQIIESKDRDWVEIYREELRIAFANDDLEALRFFLQELDKEKKRIARIEKEK
jgi:hypothetical protein